MVGNVKGWGPPGSAWTARVVQFRAVAGGWAERRSRGDAHLWRVQTPRVARNAGATSGSPCFPPSSAQLACPFLLHLSSFSHLVGRRVASNRPARSLSSSSLPLPMSFPDVVSRRTDGLLSVVRSSPRLVHRRHRAKQRRDDKSNKERRGRPAARERGRIPYSRAGRCGSGTRRSSLRRPSALRALKEHAGRAPPAPVPSRAARWRGTSGAVGGRTGVTVGKGR